MKFKADRYTGLGIISGVILALLVMSVIISTILA